MKRNVMINKMCIEYVLFLKELELKKSPHSIEQITEIMKRILSVVEKEGMLAPSHEFKMGTQTIRDNCWEHEDETI